MGAGGCGRRDRASRRPFVPIRDLRGFTIVETLFVIALAVTLVGIAVPATLEGLEETRTRNAARYLAARIRLSRAMAAARSRTIGLRFERVGDEYVFGGYEDGDRDGIRTADIDRGIDRLVEPVERVATSFPGVRFGFLEGVPAMGEDASDGDPVRAGASDILTLTPTGTATSATLYLCGRTRSQYAVRVLGTTGRTRVFQFNRTSSTWMEK
jgi:type II secretory pathway pseudopilin PulG